MNKSDIKVGGRYWYKYTYGVIGVEVLDVRVIKPFIKGRKSTTFYILLNQNSGRKITCRSALRFIKEQPNEKN